MSKIACLALALIERELSFALVAVTPGELRAGTDGPMGTMVSTGPPIDPEMACLRLEGIMPWVRALKEHLQ